MSDTVSKDKLLQIAKPILFNTEMVKAILEGRKTVTRRCVKYKYSNTEMRMRTDKYGTCLVEIQKDVEGETFGKNEDGTTWQKLLPFIEKIPPFKKGNVLYVRETWNICNIGIEENTITFIYRADESEEQSARTVVVSDEIFDKYSETMTENNPEWRPSLHMPKEAARIFLKVKDVRVERLQDITPKEIEKEGLFNPCKECYAKKETCEDCICQDKDIDKMIWSELWNSTIKKSDMEQYGWDANPWVWVIEFERIELDSEV